MATVTFEDKSLSLLTHVPFPFLFKFVSDGRHGITAGKEDTVRLKKAGKYKFYRELDNHGARKLYRE